MHELSVIAHIHTDFSEKFGIPRQSGLVEELVGRIVFEPKYREREAFRGLEDYSHIWLIWQFSEHACKDWSPTVKPPRLGGNTRMGVFATRSPFRPNQIGLSCVKLLKVSYEKEGPVLYVAGADLLDGTPIYDIKPYLPYADAHVDAKAGFVDETNFEPLKVCFDETLLCVLPKEKQAAAIGVLAQDPRPAYITDEQRIFGVSFAGFNIKFTVKGQTLTVCEVAALSQE